MSGTDFPSPGELSESLDPRSLTLMVLPTEDCNFRCAYCYESYAPGRMSPEVVRGIRALIDRRMDDIRSFRLCWFGGEPLLAKDVVFELCEFARDRCRERGVEHVAGNMTTNGYSLTTEVAARLVASNQKQFHVSLDGIGPEHDRSRPLASGKGTFDRIWANLTALRESDLDLEITLRLHYGFANREASERLCREVDRQFGTDKRFTVLLQRIADLGGENGKRLSPLPLDESKRVARYFSTLMPEIAVADVETAEDGICYAARPNHLLIRPDGRISKCAVNLQDPRNVIGRIDPEGCLHIDDQKLQPWLHGFGNLDGDILTCPYTWVRRAD